MSHKKIRNFKSTGIKVHEKRWNELLAIQDITAGDLIDKCIHRYLNDPDFRQQMNKYPLPPGI